MKKKFVELLISDIDECINLLQINTADNKQLLNQVILIKSRLFEIRKNIRIGIIKFNEYDIIKRNIDLALLEIIDVLQVNSGDVFNTNDKSIISKNKIKYEHEILSINFNKFLHEISKTHQREIEMFWWIVSDDEVSARFTYDDKCFSKYMRMWDKHSSLIDADLLKKMTLPYEINGKCMYRLTEVLGKAISKNSLFIAESDTLYETYEYHPPNLDLISSIVFNWNEVLNLDVEKEVSVIGIYLSGSILFRNMEPKYYRDDSVIEYSLSFDSDEIRDQLIHIELEIKSP